MRTIFPIFSAAAMAAGSALAAGPTGPDGVSWHEIKLPPGARPEPPLALGMENGGSALVAERPQAKTDAKPPLDADLAIATPEQREAVLKAWKDAPAPRVPKVFQLSLEPGNKDNLKPLALPESPASFGSGAAVSGASGARYLSRSPALWATPTDGKGEATTLVTGTGLHFITGDHGMSALTPGPDGRLYGTIGDQGFRFTMPSGKVVEMPNEGGAFRMEADGTGFEVFHRGLRMPSGVVFDAAGHPFTLDRGPGADAPARLILLVEGGDSGWRLGYQAVEEWLPAKTRRPSPWTGEKLWETADKAGAAYVNPPVALLPPSAAALAIHPGTGLIESEDGRLLVCDPANGKILSLRVVPDGAGMKVAETRAFATGIRPTDACFTWDGKLLVADDSGKFGTFDAGDHAWRAKEAAEAASLAREDLSKRDTKSLVPLLRHSDFRVRLLAQYALSTKPKAAETFAKAVESNDANERRHAVWGLGILARQGRGVPAPFPDEFAPVPESTVVTEANRVLASLLKNPDPEVRAAVLTAMAGTSQHRFQVKPQPGGAGKQTQYEEVAIDALPVGSLLADADPRVRYAAAIASGKLAAIGQYGPICGLLASANNRDPYLRHAGAFALAGLSTNPGIVLGLEKHPSAAVRLAAAVALRRLGPLAAAGFINDPDTAVADESIRAATDLDGDDSRLVVGYLLDDLGIRKWEPFVLRRLIRNAWRAGGAQNAGRLLKLAANSAVPEAVRVEALELCGNWEKPVSPDPLTGIWAPLPERPAAEMKGAVAANAALLAGLKGDVRAAADALARKTGTTLPAAK